MNNTLGKQGRLVLSFLLLLSLNHHHSWLSMHGQVDALLLPPNLLLPGSSPVSALSSLFTTTTRTAYHRRNGTLYGPHGKVLSEGDPGTPITTATTISVQSFLGEGFGGGSIAPSLADQTAIHIILSLASTDPTSGMTVPSAGSPLSVQAEWPVDCIIEDGSGDGQVRPCHLSMDHPTLFTTNAAGRVSFSIPLASLPSLSSSTHAHSDSSDPGHHRGLTPTLFIHSPESGEDEFTVAHVDLDCIQKLSQITADQLSQLNPQMSTQTADSLASMIQVLMGAATISVPEFKTAHRLQARGGGDKDRVLKGHRLEDLEFYDRRKNHVPVYKMDRGSMRAYRHRLDRRFVSLLDQSARHAGLAKRSFVPEHTEWLGNATVSGTNGSAATLLAVDTVQKWALAELDMATHGRGSVQYSGFLEIQAGKIIRFAVNTIDKALHFIFMILNKVELRVRHVLESVKHFFDWDDVLYTQEFLGLLYRLLAPLGFRGFRIIRHNFHNFANSLSNRTGRVFDEAIEHFAGPDVGVTTMRSLFESALVVNEHPQLLNNSNNKTSSKGGPNVPSQAMDPLSADGPTHYLQDRLINNIPHVKFLEDTPKDGNTTLAKLFYLMKDVATILVDTLNPEEVGKMMPVLLKFKHHTGYFDMGMAELMEIFRALALAGTSIATQVVEAFVAVYPAYWDLAVGLMTMPLYIPFVYDFWRARITRGHSDLTVLDILTLLGGLIATWQYKTWNHGVAPFTSTDIAVLKACKEPELLLYSWNNDPRTYAMDKPEVQNLRLGIYDWIHRSHMASMFVLFSLLYNVPLVMYKGHQGEPSEETYASQVFNAIACIMGQIQEYPFTQLTTNDPQEIQKSGENPDPRFLYWWIAWITETMIRSARPWFGATSILNRDPLYSIVNFIFEAGPWLTFGISVNLDCGKGIAPDDHARKAIVALTWVQITSKVLSLLFPFGIHTVDKSKIPVGKTAAEVWKVTSDKLSIGFEIFTQTVRQIITNIFMAYHVVGMISSAYQPKDKDGHVIGNIEKQ